MINPDWLPEGAENYRETETHAMWSEPPRWGDKTKMRKVRRKKYRCVGGPYDGEMRVAEQVYKSPHTYHEFNQSSGSRRSRYSMILVFNGLLL